MSEGLVYIGKIISIEDIPGADYVDSAEVVCGKGGKWKGVVTKGLHAVGENCLVFINDCLLDKEDHRFAFMEKHKWRVKMCRFKGSPSECLITGMCDIDHYELPVGSDVTCMFRVTKYEKEVPVSLQGRVVGAFPEFIPKTDEPNYQRVPELIEQLVGKSYYISEKYDGSSCTAYKHMGAFGVCSRNWELQYEKNNGYWKVSDKHQLRSRLPDGIALQWETCGPKIQSNPLGLKEVCGFAFSGYDIINHRYLELKELMVLCDYLKFPMVPVITGGAFSAEGVELLGEGVYDNGKPREGVVVRSQENLMSGKPISFKVINLGYEK